MARKTLLSEGEIRQFMKLANLTPLSEKYISNHTDLTTEQEEEEDVEVALDAGPAPEDEMGDVPPEMALDAEEDMEAEAGGEDAEGLIADLAAVLQQWVEDHGGEMSFQSDADVDAVEMSDEEGGEEVVDDVEAAVEMDGDELEMSDEEELVGGRDMYQEGGMKKGDQRAHVDYKGDKRGKNCKGGDCAGDEGDAGDGPDFEEGLSQDELVAEVAKRVATRLAAREQQEKTVDALAERILSRLTKMSK